MHRSPDGWTFSSGSIEPDAEIEALDAEVWVLHKERSFDIRDILEPSLF